MSGSLAPWRPDGAPKVHLFTGKPRWPYHPSIAGGFTWAACRGLWGVPRRFVTTTPHEVTCGLCRRSRAMREAEARESLIPTPPPAAEPKEETK